MKTRTKGMVLRWSAIFMMVMLVTASRAEEGDTTKKNFHPKYYFYTGAYIPNISTTFSLDGEKTPGTVISLENDLNFNSNPWLIRFEGMAQFTKRSGLSLAFVDVNRNTKYVVDRDIKIRDTTFHIGAELKMFFNTIYYAASYNYFIFSHPQWKAGVSIGLRCLIVKVGVNLETANFSGYAENVTVAAPAPVIGLNGSGYMTKRLQVRYNLDYFNISIKGISAGIIDNRLALEYYFIKNVGIGGSLNFLYFRVKEIPFNENFNGDFRYSLNGFSFFLAARF